MIAGGGPVGLTAAALLSRLGVDCLVVEADAGWCEGSRAICISRRSLEILGWCGADRPVLAKGLPWVGGRSFHRNTEVLRFTMPSEATERFPPMLNIQQYHVEQMVAATLSADRVRVLRSTRVCGVRASPAGVEVDLAGVGGAETVRCGWLVACDGGRSTVREQLGLQLEGTEYEGRYVIVDIEQATSRKVERLAWFDPPSNPGSTILMHRQPDGIWRIDYQLRDGEDPVEAVKAQNVLPRVQAHLDMVGERAPWKPLWISMYNAKCLTLPSYRAGRVLFAGDAAHLVPIFGVRGLNSGLDDAGNLAWKLALAHRGLAADALLDTYSSERVAAARANIAYGAKSTEFMAPPHAGFALMREAALRLAPAVPEVRALINPRQTSPVEYSGSPLNLPDGGTFGAGARAGMPAPEARLRAGAGAGAGSGAGSGAGAGAGAGAGITHLSALFGSSFIALVFSERVHSSAAARLRSEDARRAPPVRWVRVAPAASRIDPADDLLIDELGEAWHRYDAAEGTLYLIRPDGYVMGRWREEAFPSDPIERVIARILGRE
jgi:3-(3-hydroxy-phenyl)propionate hydroxylase